MENLDKLTKAGVSVFDCNEEHLDTKDWSKTPLGNREKWPTALSCLVNSCILPMPHCAAIFWGSDLVVIHNLTWAKARGDLDGLATSALETYGGEALGSLKAVLRGRTVKVASRYFLKEIPDQERDSQLILSTILDEKGTRSGIFAQLLLNNTVERYMPIHGLDQLTRDNPSRQLKDSQTQQDKHVNSDSSKTSGADSMQTQLFQKFAELLPTGLAILDKNAEAIFVNDGFFKLTTNKTQNEFRAWPESIHPGDYDRVMSAYREAFQHREELRCEFRCAASATGEEGEWRLFLLRPLSDQTDAGFISAIVDITEIKQAQLTQERAATEAQERKEQQERFIDMVSHEIRNPLSAVLHLAEEVKEVTKEIGSTHPDIKEQVHDILDATDTILLCVSHQNTLVDDILSFSKLDSMMLSLVPRLVRPKWEFSTALKVFHSEFKAKHIKFHYAMDVSYDEYSIDHVVADLNRMNQVLVNLITNAVKFTSRKNGDRNITVSLGASKERPTSYPPNVIYFSQDQESFHIDSTMSSEWGSGAPLYLMVAVKDTGIGISKEGQAKLFERFRQATPKTQEKYGGSGLGLFISRKLCQLHGGDIGVSSIEGQGSTFGFFFRVRRSETEEGRPAFQTRSDSDSSQPGSRDSSAPKRPGFSRGNSNLAQIKERQNERPQLDTLTSHHGVDDTKFEESLLNPPTEHRAEAHPESSEDNRYQETAEIAKSIQPERAAVSKAIEDKLPDLQSGETERQETAADDTSREQSKQRSDDKQTLLLVEDNLINQKVLRRQLQSRGFEVFSADNGQEAIDAVEKRGQTHSQDPNDRDYFDVILMDQEMPIKDGNAATREIRQLQKDGKTGYSHILGVSANVREAQTRSMRDAGMDDVISKPFKVDDLVKRIRDITAPNKRKDKTGPPATDTEANEEVRMLEDLSIAPDDDDTQESQAKVEIGGNAADDKRAQSERGDKSRVAGAHNYEEGDDDSSKDENKKKDNQENKNASEEGKNSSSDGNKDNRLPPEQYTSRDKEKKNGREGDKRGGERSRTREPPAKKK